MRQTDPVVLLRFARLLENAAREAGVDVDEMRRRSQSQTVELAKRRQESVIPLFIERQPGRPDRIGSCVLVKLDSDFYAFTAAHVIEDAKRLPFWAPAGPKGKLAFLPAKVAIKTDRLGVGIIPLRSSHLGRFAGYAFLTGSAQIDEANEPDDLSFTSYYFVLGYPASRTQTKINHGARQINLIDFHLSTSPPDPELYAKENLAPSDHIPLEFDPKNTLVNGTKITPPRLRGCSGGGVFHMSRFSYQGPLVAIATEHRASAKVIVGTRIKHFLAAARLIKSGYPSDIFV